jgi:hypothetical protein
MVSAIPGWNRATATRRRQKHNIGRFSDRTSKNAGVEMLITTTKGEMDDSLLEKKEGIIDTENETTRWVEYWQNNELVHRSVDMTLKRNVATLAVAQPLG